jgi:iron complex transport system permease protein
MKPGKAGYRVHIARKIVFYSIICVGVLLFAVLFAASVGSARIPLGQSYRILLFGLPGLRRIVDVSGINPNFIIILHQVRLPRICLAVLVGTALSASGVMYQGLFRNPMADPYIIGVSSGASVAAAIYIVTGLSATVLGFSGLMFFTFGGAFGVSLLVFAIARTKSGYIPVLKLVLSGIAVGALCSAVTSFLMMSGREEMHRIVFWILGSLTTARWSQIVLVGPVIAAGTVLLFLFTKDLNLMALGEHRAKQLGLNAESFKTFIILFSSLIVAAAVSVSGVIGFVGLIIPHIMRILVGPDNRVLYPVSAFTGGIVLLLADTLARTVMAPREVPVGIITALLGSPFFIYLLKTERKKVSMQ